MIAFVLLMAAWALTSGGLRVGAAFKLTKEHGRWWLIFSGLVSIVFGVLLAMAPLWGAGVLTWWLGVYALMFGGSLLVVAFKLRGRKRTGARRASTTLPSACPGGPRGLNATTSRLPPNTSA